MHHATTPTTSATPTTRRLPTETHAPNGSPADDEWRDGMAAALFRAASAVRYVALYRRGDLRLAERPGLANASAPESDRYEELLVNPTLLTLTRQRGEIDCRGLEFLLIRYGHFFQLVCPVDGGHLSVGIERAADVLAVVGSVLAAARAHGLLRAAA